MRECNHFKGNPKVCRDYLALQGELRHAIAQISTIGVASLTFHKIRAKRTTVYCVLPSKLHACIQVGDIPETSLYFRQLHGNFLPIHAHVAGFLFQRPERRNSSLSLFGGNSHKKARNGATRNETAMRCRFPPRSNYPHPDLEFAKVSQDHHA